MRPASGQIFTRDYWGSPMSDIQSHKSFRPVTTATFRLNWMLSEHWATNGTDAHTHGFHLVNVGLHGIVTALVTHTSSYVFDGPTQTDLLPQLMVGLIFALHPVHAEVTSNLTSRGEMLMMLFALIAFVSYAHHIHHRDSCQSLTRRVVGIYMVPWVCMTLSLFSKEQGASALMSLVVYDLVHNHGSFRQLAQQIGRKERDAIQFVQRASVLALQTVMVCLWRYWLNGETSPDFIADQNPAGFAQDRFTRVFSVSWVYCLYVWDMLMPKDLSPDWSGVSIPLIDSRQDARIVGVLLLWLLVAAAVWSLCAGPPRQATSQRLHIRRVSLIAFWAFTFCPFLLSSNLLVVVGLMKADRVLYSPLMGFCILEALLVQMCCMDASFDTERDKQLVVPRKSLRYWFGYVVCLLQLGLFSAKVHERNIAWSDSLNLWMRAYQINPRSTHTMYNCGYELSLKKRYEEAEQVLRPIGDPHVDGPSNTFVYVMVLYNLGRCEEAHDLIDEAMKVLNERRRIGGPRNTERSLNRVESNLMVARSFCTKDLPMAGKIMYDAVQIDPTNEYAIQQATNMMNHIQQQALINEEKKRLGLI